MFVFELVFVLGLCRGCGLIGLWPVDQCVLWMWVGGLWPVGRWWWVVDPWVAVVSWCDCRGYGWWVTAWVWLVGHGIGCDGWVDGS